jgi:hypothetical protein
MRPLKTRHCLFALARVTVAVCGWQGLSGGTYVPDEREVLEIKQCERDGD